MLVQGLRNMAKPQSRDRLALSNDVLDQVAEQLLTHVDPEHGGVGSAPKFPQSGLFDLLWRAFLRTGKPDYSIAVVNTITRMAQAASTIISAAASRATRSEEHTSELQSLMRISYAVFCLKKKKSRR